MNTNDQDELVREIRALRETISKEGKATRRTTVFLFVAVICGVFFIFQPQLATGVGIYLCALLLILLLISFFGAALGITSAKVINLIRFRKLR